MNIDKVIAYHNVTDHAFGLLFDKLFFLQLFQATYRLLVKYVII